MKVVCAWCEKELVPEKGQDVDRVSHGICDDCRNYFFPVEGPPAFETFLERLSVPVLLVDNDVRIILSNSKACALLGKEPEAVEGGYGGDAIECPYARLPQGCGHQLHCRSCTIRLMITDTYATGVSHYDVPAYQDIYLPHGAHTLCFYISTQKSDDLILLKIAEP